MRWNTRHQPRKGEKFNDKDRGPYRANGYVVDIDWDQQQIQVKFWTKEDDVFEWAYYSFDEIDGCWTEKFGGTWVMVDEPGDWLLALLWKLRKQRELGYIFGS